MNEITPGKLRGSLLERAGSLYDFGTPTTFPPVEERQPMPAAATVASPVPDAGAAVAPVASGRVRAARRTVAIDRDLLAERGMLVPGGPVTALAEEFRVMKRHLLTTASRIEERDEARARSILVTSAQPDEGKTFCAINLALSLAAERDVEVLLVDADFAKPDLPATLGFEAGPGLLDAIADPASDIEDHILATDIPNLLILPAGAPSNSDTELVASRRGRAMIEALATADPHRIVLFDSPPLLAASHASVLGGLVGQALLIVRADATSESDLREAVGTIDMCDHVALALNKVTFQPGGRRLGSYYWEQAE